MASKQSEANKKHYETIAAHAQSGEQLSPEEAGAWNDAEWTKLAAEPGGVDFLEVEVGGRPALWIVPKGAALDRVILYIHGGGFVGGSIYTHRKMIAHLAKATGCRALAMSYDFVYQGQHYPAQRNQAVDVYRWLLDQGIEPRHIAGAGDSAGATILFGALLVVRDRGLPLPAAIMSISGWFDMTASGASYQSNSQKDLFFQRETVQWLAGMVLAGADPRDPYASPLFADVTGFPPLFLQASGDETLLDDSRVFAERARAAGVDVRVDVFPQMLHSFQMMAGRAPEADDAIARFAAWVRPRLGLPGAENNGS
ncbi:alpha/beta hydrolase [Rhizobium rhizogenes]|uniref:alpha/beta hydrolase n=1 Tax=Rhizobium rhizogenes TaxID=359 RepID=UPI00226FD974|nr:alpha/beta hydrolase [Rhizobium rhizogenes]